MSAELTSIVQLVLYGLVAGSVYALMAVGFTLIYGVARVFHIAHAGVFTTAGYVAYTMVALCRWPVGLGFGVAIVVASLLGLAIHLAVYRPLERLGADPLVMIVASIGVLTVMENGLAMIFSNTPRFLGGSLKQARVLGAVSVTDVQIAIVLVAVIAFGAVRVFLARSEFGTEIRAVTDNRYRASVVGIPRDLVSASVYLIGSAFAAVAGISVAIDGAALPYRGTPYLLKAAIASILGGVGSINGAFLAAYLLGLLENVSNVVLPSEWRSSLVFFVFAVMVVVRPKGLFGS